MRKVAVPITLFLLLITTPLFADRGKHHSYFSYDDGGTVVRGGEDGRDVEARVNMPVLPGDEIITNRRGRAEIRLSDGNVIALDRSTAIRFQSILDSYDGDGSQTVVNLAYGHVIVARTEQGREYLRMDTASASYVANDEAIYSIDTDDQGRDRVTVFDGFVEVRTPQRTAKLRAGESAKIDDSGPYAVIDQSRWSADDFERWFIRRAERWGGGSRYLDRSLAYADSDLSSHGNWIFVGGYNTWAWRPYVGVGWRPYYHGRWYPGRSGALIWVSYEPWGWVPYHYGRWAYDSLHGWVWLPGTGYAPAWVYWMYGPGYVGWAPAGWYDCYRPYYNWCYRPYQRATYDFGFGFYGRIRVNEVDLRPWTFVNPNGLITDRVDRAALTTDAIRDRLSRNGGGVATVSGSPARFTRNELRDPDTAIGNIVRRGGGSGTGAEGSGSTTDMTPFFRRDPELSNNVRDRIVRTRPSDGTTRTAGGTTSGGSGDTRGGSGSVEGRVGRGSLSGGNIERGGVTRDTPAGPVDRGTVDRGTDRVNRGGDTPGSGTDRGTDRLGRGSDGGSVRRGGDVTTPSTGGGVDRGGSDRGNVDRGGDRVTRDRDGSGSDSPSGWRDRVGRPSTPSTPAPAPAPAPSTGEQQPPSDRTGAGSRDSESWRGRAVVPRDDAGSGGNAGGSGSSTRESTGSSRGSDVPRRVIDRVLGGSRSGSSGSSDSGRSSAGSRDSGGSRNSGGGSARSSDGGGRSSGGSSGGGRSSSGSSGGSSGGSSSGSSGGGGRSSGGGGGRVDRDQ